MGKMITRSFKVDPEAWSAFEDVCRSTGKSTGEILRELIGHAEAGLEGVEAGRIRSFEGDLPKFIQEQFPQLGSHELRIFSAVLKRAAEVMEKKR